MHLGVQYYRPPFPAGKHWADDFKKIRDSGLNTVQLWVVWGWVESKPGQFVFDDYDRLVELAGQNGLGLVLSTIAEVQPHWIHRVVPGSEMITNMGLKVVSCNRCECHFGVTPGGCTDHPVVWERMAEFLRQTVTRYRSVPALAGWDAWNELRWNVHADGLVCFCGHTLKAFRDWLDAMYGGLSGLNAAWQRRYAEWDEVMPGKRPDRPYTEMMAWQHFIAWRSNRHGQARFDLMKALDPRHPVTVHAGEPSALTSGGSENYPIERGNDWVFADGMDGVGCSSFPKWGGMDDADFGMRVEFVKSAARNKLVWLSEVQGGRAGTNFDVHAPVDAMSQQRWIWNGIACGAETILFWCWRDEVFGRESAGFGIVGRDGKAEERLQALRTTGRLLKQHEGLLEGYRPAIPEVGILFSPQSYYMAWAAEGRAARIEEGLLGYARSLVRKSIPYRVVEEEHLDALQGLRVLFLPRCMVSDPDLEARLESFVTGGGTLVCESECGAFSRAGIYREPDERFLARLTGAREIGRRQLTEQSVAVRTGDGEFRLPVAQWTTPMTESGNAGTVWARNGDGALIREVVVGKGRVILIGSYLGDAYGKQWSADFESFVESIVRQAGVKPEIEILEPALSREQFLYVKSGSSGVRKVVFVFFPAGVQAARLRFAAPFFGEDILTEGITGKALPLIRAGSERECLLTASPLGISVLIGKSGCAA